MVCPCYFEEQPSYAVVVVSECMMMYDVMIWWVVERGGSSLSLSRVTVCLIHRSRRRQLHERIGMNVGSRTVVRDVIPLSTTVL